MVIFPESLKHLLSQLSVLPVGYTNSSFNKYLLKFHYSLEGYAKPWGIYWWRGTHSILWGALLWNFHVTCCVMLCRARKKLDLFHKCHNSLIYQVYSKEVASILVGSDAKVSNWWIRMRIKISFKETPTDLHKRRKIEMWRIQCQVTATEEHHTFCFCTHTYIWAFFNVGELISNGIL